MHLIWCWKKSEILYKLPKEFCCTKLIIRNNLLKLKKN